jgi:hypothetical protein
METAGQGPRSDFFTMITETKPGRCPVIGSGQAGKKGQKTEFNKLGG